MSEFDYDLITLGAGSGGVRASRLAGSFGARVAVIEEDRAGGTCVLRGCVPKKLLVYGGHVAHDCSFVDTVCYRCLKPGHNKQECTNPLAPELEKTCRNMVMGY